jgi:uncharacterized protein
MYLFDGHAHLAPAPGALNKYLQTMDAYEIKRAVVVSGGTVTPQQLAMNMVTGEGLDIEVDNLTLKAQTDSSNERLVAFFFANPWSGPELYRRQGRGFAGLKLGPVVHGIALNDPRTHALIEVAEEFNHPVYLHCLPRTGFGVSDLVILAKHFPNVTFILGHAGVGNCDFHAVQLIEAYSNILFETSGGFSAVIQAACRQLGSKRVLFGTEYPLQHPSVEIEKILCLDLSESERQSIVYDNMASLLRRAEHV